MADKRINEQYDCYDGEWMVLNWSTDAIAVPTKTPRLAVEPIRPIHRTPFMYQVVGPDGKDAPTGQGARRGSLLTALRPTRLTEGPNPYVPLQNVSHLLNPHATLLPSSKPPRRSRTELVAAIEPLTFAQMQAERLAAQRKRIESKGRALRRENAVYV